MYALYDHTPEDSSVLYVSTNKDSLIEKLRELAAEHALMLAGYDDDTFNEFWKEGIDNATTFWSDEDDEYPYWLEISSVLTL